MRQNKKKIKQTKRNISKENLFEFKNEKEPMLK